MDSKKLAKSILLGVLAGVASAVFITLVISLIFKKDFVQEFLHLDGGIMWAVVLSIGDSVWFYQREKKK